MLKHVISTVVCGLVLSASASSAVPKSPHYVLHMAMFEGANPIAQPVLAIAAGEPSQFVLEPGNGSSYRATVIVNPLGDGRLEMTSSFQVKSASTGNVSASPKLIVRPSENATVEFGTRGGGLQPFRAELRFEPVDD